LSWVDGVDHERHRIGLALAIVRGCHAGLGGGHAADSPFGDSPAVAHNGGIQRATGATLVDDVTPPARQVGRDI